MTLQGNRVEGHAGAALLRDSYDDATLYAFKLTHDDAVTPSTGTGSSIEWIGYVSQVQTTNGLNAVVSGSVTIKLTGAPKFTAAT